MAERIQESADLRQVLGIGPRPSEAATTIFDNFLAFSNVVTQTNQNSFGLMTWTGPFPASTFGNQRLPSPNIEASNTRLHPTPNEVQINVDDLFRGAMAAQEKEAKKSDEAIKTNDKALKWAQDHILELEREIQTLKESRACKVCMDLEVSHVFIPCGHVICCDKCVGNVKRCPMCRASIQGSLVAYFS